MVRNYVRKTNKSSWSHKSMSQAVLAIVNKNMAYKKASIKFGIPQTTLERYVKKCKETQPTNDSPGKFEYVFIEEQPNKNLEGNQQSKVKKEDVSDEDMNYEDCYNTIDDEDEIEEKSMPNESMNSETRENTPDVYNTYQNITNFESINTMNKEALLMIIDNLRKENEKLKLDNERLNALLTQFDDLSKMSVMSKEIIRNLEVANKYSVDLSRLANVAINNAEEETYMYQMPNAINGTTDTPVEFQYHSCFVNNENCDSTDANTEKIVNLGITSACYVNAEKLSKCDHRTVNSLTSQMMDLLFTKEELQTSSLTGTISNFHKNKLSTPKKKLNTDKVLVIKEYVKKVFPKEDIEKEVIKTMQRKCNNAVPRVRLSKKD